MMGDWTFFSNYGHVLVCLAKNRQARLRDVALEVGITERAVQKIVRDLQDKGFVTVSKQGRCNRYRINNRKTLRHSLESNCTIGKLLSLVLKSTVASEKPEIKGEALQTEAVVIPEKKVTIPQEKKSPTESPAEATVAAKPVDTRQQGSLF
jgi:Mn-dependent DtxR family transcriptional regulator